MMKHELISLTKDINKINGLCYSGHPIRRTAVRGGTPLWRTGNKGDISMSLGLIAFMIPVVCATLGVVLANRKALREMRHRLAEMERALKERRE